MVNVRNSTATHLHEVLVGQNYEELGIDPDAPTPEEISREGIYVPETRNHLSDAEMADARFIIANTQTNEDFVQPITNVCSKGQS